MFYYYDAADAARDAAYRVGRATPVPRTRAIEAAQPAYMRGYPRWDRSRFQTSRHHDGRPAHLYDRVPYGGSAPALTSREGLRLLLSAGMRR